MFKGYMAGAFGLNLNHEESRIPSGEDPYKHMKDFKNGEFERRELHKLDAEKKSPTKDNAVDPVTGMKFEQELNGRKIYKI